MDGRRKTASITRLYHNTKNSMKVIYQFVNNVLSSIPVDKYIHVVVCIIIAGLIAHLVPFQKLISAVVAVVTTLVIGVAKEFYDKKEYGLFDWNDIIADVCGAVIGALIGI